jgi:hypothetical protein
MLWKAGPFIIFFFQASGIITVPERLAFPWRPVRGPSGFAGPRPTAIRQRGIVADWNEWSKRKVCEGNQRGAHLIHSFSTSTIIVQRSEGTFISAEFFT